MLTVTATRVLEGAPHRGRDLGAGQALPPSCCDLGPAPPPPTPVQGKLDWILSRSGGLLCTPFLLTALTVTTLVISFCICITTVSVSVTVAAAAFIIVVVTSVLLISMVTHTPPGAAILLPSPASSSL